jgi:putative Mn2+ efflux pump MntP
MDCFTVSLMSGVILRRAVTAAILRMALLFGLFQAAMPLAGWLATAHFSQYLEAVDHWIAFGLLAFIGGKMIWESIAGDDSEPSFNPLRLRTQLLLAVATSIDALAVGISLAVTGYHTIRQLAWPLVVIGLGSFLFGVLGHLLGMRFGESIRRRLKPELLGGIILIAIGVKVLVTHLCDV